MALSDRALTAPAAALAPVAVPTSVPASATTVPASPGAALATTGSKTESNLRVVLALFAAGGAATAIGLNRRRRF